MNKLYYFISIFFLLLLSSCNNKIEDFTSSSLIVEKFNLSHFNKSGEKLYMLETPYSVFNKSTQTYSLKNTNIKFFDLGIVKYIISADSARLSNSNKLIELKGNIEISDIKNNKTTIKSESLTWNIDKSEFILYGNVKLVNNKISLNSSKAILDKNTNIILFFNPVKYNFIDDNNITKYNIKSENAYYDLVNKNVVFKSETSKVKSKLLF